MTRDYHLESMRNAIKACYKNIDTFHGAIAKELSTIEEYKEIVKHLEKKEAIAKIQKAVKDGLVSTHLSKPENN